MVNKNEEYQLEIIDINSEGNGVGKIDSFAVFVPGVAIGDIITVGITKVLKSYAFGRVVNIIKPSLDRIELDCNVSQQCGGCIYRHISYEAELRIKQAVVSNAFKRLGKIGCQCDTIVGSEQIDEYRNKSQLPVGVGKSGEIVAGFYAQRSHRIISCDSCRLQSEIFSEIQKCIIEFMREYKLMPYDETTHKGLVRHIYIRVAEATREIMVCLVATGFNIPHIEVLIDKLRQNKDVASIVINKNCDDTNVILGSACKTVFGKDSITDVICGVEIDISPLAFYQVNKRQAEKLYSIAVDYADISSEDTVVDLYCGTGTIGLIASSHAKKVIGVEIVPQAIENAKRNAVRNSIDNTEFICADAKAAAKKLALDGIAPDVIIVDPPRKGLDIGVIEAIAQMAPKRIVMVSCNPATAARDTALLVEKGYEAVKITPVDMFPRTGHIEVVIQMTFCGDKKK